MRGEEWKTETIDNGEIVCRDENIGEIIQNRLCCICSIDSASCWLD